MHHLKINFPGYDTLQYDKNRNSGGVACYIWIYVLIKKALNCKEIENIIFDILESKSKLITKAISYRHPNQDNFTELIKGTVMQI